MLALGLTDGDPEALGLTEAEGLTDGLSLADGLMEADGLILADGDIEADGLELGGVLSAARILPPSAWRITSESAACSI